MFNAPRSAANQRYLSGADAFGASFVEDNPLAGSVYDSVDPWSAAPTPSPPSILPQPSSLFNSVIADASVPAIYHSAFSLVDPDNSGETSVNSLSRVLGTSSLAAGTIDKIVNLVSSKPRVSRLEFFVALALVALAQAGKDVSIEQVAALSSQNTLPEPKLDLDSMPPSASAFSSRQNTTISARSPAPQYSTDDPWSAARNSTATTPAATSIPTKPSYPSINIGGPANSTSGWTNGAPSSLSGSGLPNEWWKKQETVKVTLLGQQGFILNRYMVYQVATERGEPVARRYSEFVYLWECLTRRYPFRLFPALPPKRVGRQCFVQCDIF
jgi:sorting nexin-8